VDSRSEHRTLTSVRTLKLLGLDRISLDSLTARSSCGVSSCYYFTTDTDTIVSSISSNSQKFFQVIEHWALIGGQTYGPIVRLKMAMYVQKLAVGCTDKLKNFVQT